MKKYWKFTAIIIVIVLSIGTFYVNAAMSAEQYPEFVIKTKSGDANEIKPLVLEGSYEGSSSMNYVHSGLRITEDGSKYKNRSFLVQVLGQPPTLIKDLQERYRGFMRAKRPFVSNFFENDQFLAYAYINYKSGSLRSRDFTFEISVLNKNDGNTTTFKMKVPNGEDIDHIFVEDVQMVDESLHIITQNMMRNDDNFYDENHIYTVDIVNQNVSNHETIIQTPERQENTNIDARLIGTRPTEAYENLILQKTESKLIEEAESTRVEETIQEIITYNLLTKETETLQLPDELSPNENDISFYDGSTIYLTRVEENNLIITPYNIEEDQVGHVFSTQLSGKTSRELAPLIRVKEGKLYVTIPEINHNIDSSIFVVDLETGETLYDGELAIKDGAGEDVNFKLYIHDMYVK